MECNKDEAARAKTIAEKKLQDRDFAGAKKFALKAQNLYPPLEGLSQTLTTLDVYVAAENKISGEIDWYGVLGVAPSADDETIRKQYRKLALMLHPDKNKSVGADGAFKLLSEAWGLLSDKGKRLAYNQRRSSRGFQHKVPSQTGRSPAAPNGSQTGRPPAAQSGIGSQTGRPPAAQSGIGSQTGRPAAASGGIGSQTGRPAAAPSGTGSQTGKPSAATSGNGFHNFTNRAHPKPKTHKSTVPPPAFRRADTFWTICHNCKMHYEYLRVYLNHTLLCPNCHQAFMAAEMAPPANFPKSSNSSSQQSHQNINNHAPISKPGKTTTSTQNVRQGGSAGPNLGKHSNSYSGAYSNVAGTSNTEPSIAAKAANVIQHVNERLKREREESQGSVLKGEGPSKRRVVDSGNHYHGDKLPFKAPTSDGAGLRSISGLHGVSAVNNIRPNGTRELTLLETRNMLMEKALKEVKKKLSEWNTEAANKAEEKRKLEQRKKEQMKTAIKSDEKVNVVGESSLAKDETAEHFNGTSVDTEDKEESVALSMNVPDPDFHDFDMDRTESSFGDNQTWAAYDDDDGMPRFYAFIHKVISRKPFKMKISWLNSKTNSEFGPLEWVTSGFSKTCGEFRVGKYEVNKSLNSFSHKVKWTKGARGVLQILPKKGDVWALYRNWSHDWNEHTPDEVIHKYDMVEVLDDYNEEGVSVTSLIKVAGFRTVFHPQQDSDKVMRIPKEEMFRFSHQVPHYILTGQEAKNAPKGFLELDPAATPLELLQVITEADTLSMKKGANFKEKLQGTATTGVVETAEGSEAEKGQMV